MSSFLHEKIISQEIEEKEIFGDAESYKGETRG